MLQIPLAEWDAKPTAVAKLQIENAQLKRELADRDERRKLLPVREAESSQVPEDDQVKLQDLVSVVESLQPDLQRVKETLSSHDAQFKKQGKN
jgi:hypothetical protein